MDQEKVDDLQTALVESVELDIQLHLFELMIDADDDDEREKIEEATDEMRENCKIVIEKKLEEL